MKQPLVLIDGSSYFFRAFHAMPPLTNSSGQPTGAIYGVANMLKRFIKEHKPTHFVVIFDAKGKTFRDDWYPEYKAHRPPTPPDLSAQFEPLIQLLEAMGIPVIIVKGVEADDVIGTLADLAMADKWPVLISTGDKDMAQLVNEHVTLINTMTNQRLDIAGVIEKFGVHPDQIIDYLALVGDTSDNVPGIPNCGPKTAVKWLTKYKNIDTLIENAHEIAGKIGESLRVNIEQLRLSKQLVTLKKDVDLPLSMDELALKTIEYDRLIELTRSFEFNTWTHELISKRPNTCVVSTANINQRVVIKSADQLRLWIKDKQPPSNLYLELHTDSVDPMCANIHGIALAVRAQESIYISFAENQMDLNLEIIRPWLEAISVRKIGHNLKYACTVLQNHNITLHGVLWDTLLAAYLLNSNSNKHDLNSLSTIYLGKTPVVPVEKITPALTSEAALDHISLIIDLHPILLDKLEPTLTSVLNNIELPLIQVLAALERRGVCIDTDLLSQQSIQLKKIILELEAEAALLAGRDFNLNSPKQLQAIFYQELNYPIIAKTPKGQPSTAEPVLQKLALSHRLPAVILEHRSLSKLVSTYLDALPKRVNTTTHRVHTSYNQAITSTGRLSSSDPNLQNIPVRSQQGRLIRQAFIAPKNSCLLAADYSQIELRIMAHLSQDPHLLHAFAHDLDVHAATASELFNTPVEQVNLEQRRRAKAVNFGLMYGMSAFGLAKQLHTTRDEAQHYIDCYFKRHPGVMDYMERTRANARQYGYVETVWGRRLYLPEIHARNIMQQKAAERMAINGPMQGSAADIIKKAMINIYDWQQEQNTACMIMQVHDELVFEVDNTAIETSTQKIRFHMENAVSLSVPLQVSIGVGKNWDLAH